MNHSKQSDDYSRFLCVYIVVAHPPGALRHIKFGYEKKFNSQAVFRTGKCGNFCCLITLKRVFLQQCMSKVKKTQGLYTLQFNFFFFNYIYILSLLVHTYNYRASNIELIF